LGLAFKDFLTEYTESTDYCESLTYKPLLICKKQTMDLNDITYKIRGAIFTIHKELGPGLLESVYEAALLYELQSIGLNVKSQLGIPVKYKDVKLELGFRMDILVEDLIIIEIKSIEILHDVHKKQLLTYLKLSNKKLGILVNFNASVLKDKESIIRIIN
jgi:GxxExxY protein